LIDILQRLVGDIEANRKRETPRIEKLGRREWRIDARVLIADVNTALNVQIPTDRCDTIGGFILMLLGRLPQEGEKVEYENLEFNIDEVLKYRISGIRVIKKTVRKTKR
jgi:CBS domain containing-hemolysin-like protein